MELVWPSLRYLPSYVAALKQGWSPNTSRSEAAQEELAKVASDPEAFLAELVLREPRGETVTLPDGSKVPRLPGYRRWLWDGEFCGSIALRWQVGTHELPPHCLGHVGYSVVSPSALPYRAAMNPSPDNAFEWTRHPESAEYIVELSTPSSADYRRLRVAAGLSEKTEEAARRGLRGTLFAVQILHAGRSVGMGRVVGDGGCFYQVVDIAVSPEHQGQGLGKRIMAEIMKFVEASVPPSAYVSLIADGQAPRLYAQFGFRATAPLSVGMALKR
jgi:ribosomal protein S18 acetylase RimI-like enzyme